MQLHEEIEILTENHKLRALVIGRAKSISQDITYTYTFVVAPNVEIWYKVDQAMGEYWHYMTPTELEQRFPQVYGTVMADSTIEVIKRWQQKYPAECRERFWQRLPI